MQKSLNKAPSAVRKWRPERWKAKLRRILVPLDFSGLSRQALWFAVPLARKHHAKISLVHVVQAPVVLTSFPGDGSFIPVGSSIEDLKRPARAHLNKLADRLLPAGLRDRTIVREGNAAFEVVSAARALKADLIVLSTNGRSGLPRVMLGSTAERIVRHAHCPVLTVRRQTGATTERMLLQEKPVYPERLPWKRILVPLDFSLTSLRALELAVQLARESGARLYLLNVVEPNPYSAGMDGSILVLPDTAVARNARKQLPEIARHFVPKPLRAVPLVRQGRAADVIVETAAKHKVDLIVLSTHGHTGLERLLMGSTAEHVVRHAKCPVFVLRHRRGTA